jgi:hypothetical protein
MKRDSSTSNRNAVLNNELWSTTEMNATRFILAAMVIGSAISVNQAGAQCSGNAGSCNLTNTASVVVNPLVKLAMGSATTTLTPPTADQIEVGATIADNGPSFTVKANRSWTLNVKTTNATSWTYAGPVTGTKPISDLTWSNAAAGTFVGISTTDAAVTTGASASNGASVPVFFKTVWAAGFTQPSNAPGTYTLPVVFTLSAP